MVDFDMVVVGSGIVGMSTAMQLAEKYPGKSIAVLEKEDGLARHQSGRNSGVIHAGVYYEPGSLKAEFCHKGSAATYRFCEEYGIAHDRRGKLLVATDSDELPRMQALYDRATANGLTVERLDAAELKRREPHITGLGALFVSSTGIVDYVAVLKRMSEIVTEGGGTIITGAEVTAIHEKPSEVEIVLADERIIRTHHMVACAGVQSDRIAKMCGLAQDIAIIPFRGEYFRLGEDKNTIVHHLIYPIPDPELPFLGVHLTPMVAGFVTVGPNAVLAFGRNAYSFGAASITDLIDMAKFPGFWKVIAQNYRSGLTEMANSLSRSRYLALCQRYCPELTLSDLTPHPAGIRAQAVSVEGKLLHDFLIERTARTIHVLNAPSPAATSAMPIGEHIVDLASKHFTA